MGFCKLKKPMKTHPFELQSSRFPFQGNTQLDADALFFSYMYNPSTDSLSKIYEALKKPAYAQRISALLQLNEHGCESQKALLELILGVKGLQGFADPARIQELMRHLQHCNFNDNHSAFLLLHLAGKIFQAAAGEAVNQKKLNLPFLPFIFDWSASWRDSENEGKKLILQALAEYCFLLSLQANEFHIDLYGDLAGLLFHKLQNRTDEKQELLKIPLVPLNFGINELEAKILSLMHLPHYSSLATLYSEIGMVEEKRKACLKLLVVTLSKHKKQNGMILTRNGCAFLGHSMGDLRQIISTMEELCAITEHLKPQEAYRFLNHLLTLGTTKHGDKLDSKGYSSTFVRKIIKNHGDIKSLLAMLKNWNMQPFRMRLYRRLCENGIISPHIQEILNTTPLEDRQKLLSFSKRIEIDSDSNLEEDTQEGDINHSLEDLLAAIENAPGDQGMMGINQIKNILISRGYKIQILQNIISNLHDLSLVLEHMDNTCVLTLAQYIITDKKHEDSINLAGKLNLSGKTVDDAFLKKIIPTTNDIKTLLGLIHNYNGATHRNTLLNRFGLKHTTRSRHVYNLLTDNPEDARDIQTFACEVQHQERKKIHKIEHSKPATPVALPEPINHSLENLISAIDKLRRSEKITIAQLKNILIAQGYKLSVLQGIIRDVHALSLLLENMDYHCGVMLMQYIITGTQHEVEIDLSKMFTLYDKAVDNAFMKKLIHNAQDIKTFTGLIENMPTVEHRHKLYSRLCRSEHVYNILASNQEDIQRIYAFSLEGFELKSGLENRNPEPVKPAETRGKKTASSSKIASLQPPAKRQKAEDPDDFPQDPPYSRLHFFQPTMQLLPNDDSSMLTDDIEMTPNTSQGFSKINLDNFDFNLPDENPFDEAWEGFSL